MRLGLKENIVLVTFHLFRDPQSEKKLTGGANWTPQVAPTSWGTPGAPMVRTETQLQKLARPHAAVLVPGFKMFCVSRPLLPLQLPEQRALAWSVSRPFFAPRHVWVLS